ncbi:hypothetical protein ACFFJB_09000 [Camelimonas abortus]|uniref:Uncharacterized protein n=1 Tax=Camelimonas abortus TaxID=1017184 RepID=A0ABV7LG84_9HYPH
MSGAQLDFGPERDGARRFWMSLAPYVAMLLLVFAGMAFTSLSPASSALYWQITAVIFAGTCILSEWSGAPKGERLSMAVRQALHWLVVIVAMRVLFYDDVLSAMTPMALGLAVLGLLAMGTLLAAIHLASWQIGVVGALLALGLPAALWLERVSLLVTAAAVVALAIAGGWFWQKRKLQGP